MMAGHLTAKERKGILPGKRKLALAFIALFYGFQSSGESAGAWPTYHGDASLKGAASVELPQELVLKWRFNAGGEICGTPVSDGERIYFAAKKGRLYAIDLEGNRLWDRSYTRTNAAEKAMALRFDAPLVCIEGLVFAGSTQGALHALDGKTGAEKWRYETGGIIVGSPNYIAPSAEADGHRLVVLDQSEGMLHGLDVDSGKRLWKTESVERCDGAPGIDAKRIVFGSCLSALHVCSTEGARLKDIEVGGEGQIAGGVAVEHDLAFAGVRDGGMLCFDLAKGAVVWSSDESEDQTFSTPAVTADRVVYTSDNGYVYAVGKKTGALVWNYDTGGLPSSPVTAGGKVVVAADGVLYLLQLKTGQMLWSKEISDDITSPAIIGGMIVVGADDGTVTAWGAADD